jgi:hypothetical protein
MKPGYEYGAKYKDILTKDVLHQLYVVEGKTKKAIAEQFGASPSIVSEFLFKYDIPDSKPLRPYNSRSKTKTRRKYEKKPRTADDYFATKLRDIRKFCDNPKCPQYKNYGGRGIDYNREWKHWRKFKEDVVSRIGPRPSFKYSLDRKNNNKGYFADNLRWATAKEQNNNQRRNRAANVVDSTPNVGASGIEK